MNKIKILKSSFDLDREMELTASAIIEDQELKDFVEEERGIASFISFKLVKDNTVEISDEDIEFNKSYPSSSCSDFSDGYESGFLACWEYIKSKIHEDHQ
jgi:hypothetical protein